MSNPITPEARVAISEENRPVKPGDILKNWKGYAQNEELIRVNWSRPELHYAMAMWASLNGIANMWTGLEPGQFQALATRGEHGRHLQIVWDTADKEGKLYRVRSIYDLDTEGPYISTESRVELFKKSILPASDLIVVSMERRPFPFLLHVNEPRDANKNEHFGHIWTATTKFVPDFYGNLSGVTLADAESLSDYIEHLKQTLK